MDDQPIINTEPTPVAQATKPKDKWKTIAIIFIALTVLAVVTGAWAFVRTNNKLDEANRRIYELTQQSTNEDEPEQEPGDTDNSGGSTALNSGTDLATFQRVFDESGKLDGIVLTGEPQIWSSSVNPSVQGASVRGNSELIGSHTNALFYRESTNNGWVFFLAPFLGIPCDNFSSQVLQQAFENEECVEYGPEGWERAMTVREYWSQ